MDTEEHKQRHIELHKSLDQLFADFVSHTEGGLKSTILDLIEWSFKQTTNPDEIKRF